MDTGDKLCLGAVFIKIRKYTDLSSTKFENQFQSTMDEILYPVYLQFFLFCIGIGVNGNVNALKEGSCVC